VLFELAIVSVLMAADIFCSLVVELGKLQIPQQISCHARRPRYQTWARLAVSF
jgi:hypothetical protein